MLLNRWRQWDWIAAQRVDRYVANSHLTAARIRRYFGRESTVLYPPVETGRFATARRSASDYMVLAELMAHKRIDVAVRAFNALRLPLRRRRRRAGAAAAAPDRGPDGHVHRARERRARSPSCSRARARSS